MKRKINFKQIVLIFWICLFLAPLQGCLGNVKKPVDNHTYEDSEQTRKMNEPEKHNPDTALISREGLRSKQSLLKLINKGALLSLDDALALALLQNRQIQMMFRQEGIVQDQIDQARSAYFPFFEFSGGYSQRNNDPGLMNRETGVGFIAGERQVFMTTIAGKYLLTDFGGRYFRLKVTQIDKIIAQLTFSEEYQRITLEVTESYFKLLQAKHFFNVVKDSVALFSEQVDVSRDLFENEIVAKNDVLSSEILLAQTKQMLITAENNIALTRAALNFKLGVDIDSPTEVVDITDIPKQELEYKRCLLLAIDNRPELKRLRSEKEKAEAALKMRKSEFGPKVIAQTSYNYTTDAYQLNDSYVSAGIFFQWDLLKGGKVPAYTREARRFVEQVVDRIKLQNDAVVLEVKIAFLRSEENRKKIEVARKAIIQAEENLRIFQDQYQGALISITDVLAAQNLLTKSRFEFYAALYDYHIALARLENAIGTRIWVQNKTDFKEE